MLTVDVTLDAVGNPEALGFVHIGAHFLLFKLVFLCAAQWRLFVSFILSGGLDKDPTEGGVEKREVLEVIGLYNHQALNDHVRDKEFI